MTRIVYKQKLGEKPCHELAGGVLVVKDKIEGLYTVTSKTCYGLQTFKVRLRGLGLLYIRLYGAAL